MTVQSMRRATFWMRVRGLDAVSGGLLWLPLVAYSGASKGEERRKG